MSGTGGPPADEWPRKAEESVQHPVAQDRLLIELALLATQRLGAAVLRPGAGVRA
jgi:hypothetical protein